MHFALPELPYARDALAPEGRLGEALAARFGTFDAFRGRFVERAVQLFGSGYVWLTADPDDGSVEIEALKDAVNPLRLDGVPLLCMDVWEHAYSLDHQNRRDVYAAALIDHLVDWRLAPQNLENGS